MTQTVISHIGISLNGIDFFDSPTYGNVNFTYYPPVQITSISPSFGPISGGTLLTLKGYNFMEPILYKIGLNDTTLIANYISSTEIQIISPARNNIMIEGFIFSTTNGRQWSDTLIRFEWINKINIQSFQPTHGPKTGGNEITIFGEYFRNSSLFKCRFKIFYNSTFIYIIDQPINRYINPDTITCMIPYDMINATSLHISLTNNGQQWSNFTDYNYTFDELIQVISVYPTVGTNLGGTLLNITGDRFIATTTDGNYILNCKFTYYSNGYYNNSYVYHQYKSATYIDSNHLQCITPTFKIKNGNVSISVTINGFDYSEQVVIFLFYDDPIISYFVPDSGRYDSFNPITIYGNYFRDGIQIRFEDNSNTTSIYYPVSNVTFINSKQIEIITPKINVSNAYRLTIEASLNGYDWTHDGILFYFYPPIIIHEIYPQFGDMRGATKITIRGSNFIDSSQLKCKFGNITTLGYYVNKDYITCIAPPSLITNHTVYFQLTNNLFTYTNISSSFTYYYHNMFNITSIYPNRGFISGGVPVTITISNGDNVNWMILSNNSAYCMFGERFIAAVSISIDSSINETSINCITPYQDYSRNVSVKVSLNNIDWTTNPIQFYYQSFPSLYNIL
eukprot:527256_1